ncbi:MAG: hypothetical protein IID15_02710 [Candidatus Marinimicrobia bacterium]|nr:hypothetical protein [Candidatus Neomarinimicrobiota bacterium]
MLTGTIYTEFSPHLDSILGPSWRRLLSAGLGLVLAGIIVLSLPRLVAGLIALGLFAIAGITLASAHHLWQLSRSEGSAVEVD